MGARGTWRRAGVFLITMAVTVSARGAPLLLSLSSTDDLSHLTIGQHIDVAVTLSGLAQGEQLISLTSSAKFDGILGTPANVQAGPIVPQVLASPNDFQSTTTATQVDAAFLTSSDVPAENIAANGDFYRFTLTAQATGSGTIALNPLALAAEQFVPLTPDTPALREVDAGPALAFTVVFPEPQSLLLLALASAMLLRRRAVRGRC